ncbi:hypothetical protein L6R52_34110, partial [Myxococcota bacterium]|nr:hypothetical protein [Myxococcota bacterium]
MILRSHSLLLALSMFVPAVGLAQTTTLQSDDGTMESLWSLTSPEAGPHDWVAVGYVPPIEHPFRVVSASMFYLDQSCCVGSACSNASCQFPTAADWDRRVITRANLTVDAAGLTPDVTGYVARELNVAVAAGSTATSPPWTMTPDTWTLPAGTVFDHPGRIFYAIKYFDQDTWMKFAVDTSLNAGTSFFTSDGFATRSAIWSFGNIGMRITVEPLFNLKLSAQQPASAVELRGATNVPMLVFRVGAGNASTTVTRVRVTASGTGNDQTGVSAVRLVVDANRNGVVDTGETTLATGTFAANDGTLDLNLSRALAIGASEEWIVAYDFNTVPTGGQTFSARIASSADVTSSLGAPFVSGTAGGTGALTGRTITIAGRLVASRGPASMASSVVAAGSTNVAPLQLRLTAENEAFDVTELAITADGTLNDVTSVTAVRLYRDADASGTVTAGDVQLASGAFTQNDGRLVLRFAAERVAAGATRDLLVVYDLSSGAAGGETFRVLVGAASDVVATGVSSGVLPATGARALSGTPIIGNLVTIGGALTIAAGAASPAAGTAQPGAQDVPMLQLQLAAQAEAVSLTQLAITASGTGDDAAHVARVELWRDVNANGLRDAGDVAIGLPQAYAASDGLVRFAFAAETIPANATRHLLVTYDFGANAPGGVTFAARLASANDVTATGQASGAVITPSATLPIVGGTRTLLGGLSLTLATESPAATNRQPGTADVPVIAVVLAAEGESFTVSSVRITAAGTLADSTGVVRAELWRDVGTAGVRDAADTLLSTAVFTGDDGTALFTIAPGRVIAPSASERWLVTYDLAASVLPGRTFRASIAAGDVVATGTLSGAATPTGLPLSGNTHAIGGTLEVALAPTSPAGGTLAPGQLDAVMASLRLTAVLEVVTISSITLSASGTGNELLGISQAELWVDTDRDGLLDAIGDLSLGTVPGFTANDGTITFAITPRTIAAGASEDWLVVYDVGRSPQAGETFQLALAQDTHVGASAPSGVLPRISGAPVNASARTVLGGLTITLGSASPAATTVRRDAQDVPVVQLALVGANEAVTVSSLTFHALGSLDDSADLTGLALYDDVDASGTVSRGDRALGTAVFAGDDGTATFSALALSLTAGATKNLLVAADLAGTALGGATLRLSLAGATSVVATGFGGRAVAAEGLPLTSATLRAGGTLEVSLGAASPLARIVQRGSTDAVAMQLRFVASTDAATVTQLVVHGTGTVHDARGTSGLAAWLDANANGRVDGGEAQLGTATFAADDGAAVFALALSVQPGPAVHVLVTTSFTGTPVGGETLELTVEPTAGVSVTSASSAVAVAGAPVAGTLFTVGGGFELAVGPASSAGFAVNQAEQGVPALQLALRAVNEACTVHGLTLRAAGSIDDARDLSGVRLVRDVNDNGVFDFGDAPIAGPATFSGDDGTVTFAGLAESLGLDASARWLVVYDLSGTATNLETFVVRLERAEDVDVTCHVSGAITPTGAPLEGGVFSIQEDGALAVTRSSQSPPALFLEAGRVRTPLLALRLAASVRDVSLDALGLVVRASATPGDVVEHVELFRDVNQDGVLDRSDRLLASSPAPDAQGRVGLAPAGLVVTPAEAVHLLVAADVSQTAVPGTTFTVELVSNGDVVASSGLGVISVSGAPLSSEVMTVAGALNVRAAMPPLVVPVANDASGLVALAIEVSSIWERFTLRSLVVTAEGSMDPAAMVAGVSLVVDDDGDGAPGIGDRVLTAGVPFPQGSKRTTFAGLDEAVEPGAPRLLFVLVELAGHARVDETLTLALAANVDVVAEGDRAGLTSPVGAPIVGHTFTIAPSLAITAGPSTPGASIVAANAEQVPALQLVVAASNEDVTMTRLSLHTDGTLDDTVGLRGAHLVLDVDEDGTVGPGDVEVATAARATADDGTITFSPITEVIARNAARTYLVTIDLSGAGSAGETVALTLASAADVTAFGAISGAVSATGAPLAGGRIT